MGYAVGMWLGFGEALAAVAGALTGLLFVAVSVKSDALAASHSLSSRAAETLVLFMTSVLIGVLLVAPQPTAALGCELLAVAAVSGIALFNLDRRAGHGSDQGVARFIERFSPNAITAVLVGVAGLTFLLKAGGGAAAAPVPKSRKITSPPHTGFGEPVAWAASEGPSDRYSPPSAHWATMHGAAAAKVPRA